MKTRASLRRSLLLCATAIFAGASAHAADGTWDTDSAGDWTDITKWLGDADYASGADFTATLGNSITADRIINLNAPITIGNITASDITHNYTISGANILTLDRTDLTAPTINVTTGGRTLTISSVVAGNDGLIKSGAGILVLGGTNSISGDAVVSAGTLQLSGTNNFFNITVNGATLTSGGTSVGPGTLGAAGGTITFTGTSTYNPQRSITGAYNKNVDISSGTTTFQQSTQFYHETFSGVLSGSGTLVKNDSNGVLTFSNAANTFTGAIRLDGGSGGLVVNSLLDSANAITFNGNTGALSLGGGTASSLVFTSRQIVLAHANGGEIANNNGSAFNTVTINSNLGFSGAGTRTLELSGSNAGANRFGGNIGNNGGSAVGVTKTGGGTWILSGTNTHSGVTGFNGAQNGGTLILQGAASASPNSIFSLSEGSTLGLRDDTAGTVTFGAPMQVNLTSQQTSARATSNINVNRISTGSNSILAVGKLNFAGITDNRAAGATVNITGGNGYGLQFSSIDLDWGISGTQNLNPTSASVTVTGTVQHINGRPVTGTVVQGAAVGTAGMGFVLDGTATGNLISGAIKNATDFDDLSNANALATNLIKSNSSTWTLSGINTYTGTTTISGGKLRITGNSSAAVGAVSVTGGALGGNSGSLGGAVTLSGSGGIDLRDGSIGGLTLGGALGSTSNATGSNFNNLSFDLGNTTGTSDSLTVAGATTVTTAGAAVITLNQLGGSAGRIDTTYTLIGGAGTLAGADFAKFSLATTAAFGQTYLLTNTGDDLQVVATNVTSATPAAFWAGGGNNWSTTTNWRDTLAGGGAVAGAPDYQTDVTFSTTSPIPGNLTTNVLDVDFDINSLTFTNASGNVTIGGTKMLTLEASGGNGIDSQKTSGTNSISAKVGLASSQTWTVATSGTLTVSGAVSDFGAGYVLTKAGGGTLNLTGATTYTGGTSITGGILTVNATSVGAINNGPLLLSNGGRLTISSVNPSSASQVSVGTGGGLISVSGNNSFTTSGKLTGSGTLTLVDPGGAGGKTFNFNSFENDFTGGLILSGAAGIALNFNSLADGANNIAFTAASGSVTAAYGSGAIAPLSLSTRAIEINSAGALVATIQNNSASQAISIGGNLVATGTGAKVLGLGAVAGVSNVYSGSITNGTGGGTIGVTKSGVGDWSISNTGNSFSGAIVLSSTTTSAGTLSYASAGGANSIGFNQTTSTATLSYTGSGQTMSGAMTASALTTGTITLDASGSGAVNYSNAASLGSAASGNKNLVLSGSNTAGNTLAGQWVNNTGGAATITKNGAGTWLLTGNNSYTGVTNVNAGTLLINGNQSSATGAVTVAYGATLGGTGTVGGAIGVSGSIAPGSGSIDTLNAGGNVTWNAGNAWEFELGASNSSDLLDITGNFTRGTGKGWTFDFLNSTATGIFTLASWTGTSTFSAGDFGFTNYAPGGSFSITSASNGSLLFTAIPEPSTALGGLLLTAGLLRRRRRHANA